MRSINILAVDDHELIIRGYELVLQYISINKFTLKLDTANDYDSAIKLLDNNFYDIAFLDIQLDSQLQGIRKTGEHIGIYIRENSPGTKIVFQSSFDDNLRIQSIFKSVNPDGYIVKTELNDSLEEAIDKILDGGTFYSPLVQDALRKVISQKIQISDSDREILYHLSQGVKTKDLEDFVNMSASKIERRKRELKSFFDIEKENDMALVREAKSSGFI